LGIEYNTNRDGEVIHFVVVGPGYDRRLEDKEDLSNAMKEWWDNGAFAFMALRNGQYYFSSGPRLEDVYLDTENKLHVRCSPVKAIHALSTVGKVEHVIATEGKTLTEATIKWNWSGAPFVRVECTDEQGRTAWSQAVLKIEKPVVK
jgi:hypothetical protein